MQQPMNCAFGSRRRDWFGRTPCGGIIRGELPGDLALKVPQDAGELFEVDCGQLDLAFGRLELLQDFVDQIQSALGSAVPLPPADPFNLFRQ